MERGLAAHGQSEIVLLRLTNSWQYNQTTSYNGTWPRGAPMILVGYQTFPEWQIARFGATNAPNAGADDDADLDGAVNHQEWLTGTDPNSNSNYWTIGASANGQSIAVSVPQVANRGFEVQRTLSLSPIIWRPLDVAANQPFSSATNRLLIVEDPTNAPTGFYRVRVFEPWRAHSPENKRADRSVRSRENRCRLI